MSLFGSLLGDVEEDPYMGVHMRHMNQMNNMMRSFLADPFSMFGGGNPLAIGGPRHSPMHAGPMMPFMPQIPSVNRMIADLEGGHMGGMGHSFSTRTVVMSSGPNGKPQVYSTSSSTKIGPNGIKETRKTLEDSRTGTKKMSIGHHIGERGHVIERAQNLYSGEREESQEFYNLEEEEAEEFDREFQVKSGGYNTNNNQLQISSVPPTPPRLAIAAPPPAASAASAAAAVAEHNNLNPSTKKIKARRPLRVGDAPATTTTSASVRSLYSGTHPQRHRHRRPRHEH